MKPSVYNAVFENGNEYVVFNTLSGALAVLDADGHAAYCASDEREFRDDALFDAGLLVADDFDERSFLMNHYRDDMSETGFLSLNIAPTVACNLRCVYCYESHEPVRMTDEVAEGVMRFVEKRWEKYRFDNLSVLWYGGEPTLEIDRIDSLAARLQAWSAEHGVIYRSSITTNASLIDDAMAKRLRAAGITWTMPTLDGMAPCHNARRATAVGGCSFDETLRGIRALQNAGMYVGVNCNMDWTNTDDYRQLRDLFAGDSNVEVFASHLRNYGGWCGGDCSQAGAAGMMQECDAARETCERSSVTVQPAGEPRLMTRQEYSDRLFELYMEQNPNMSSLYESLRSCRHFCQGKCASYFVIDPEGNVCRCDGSMRNPARVMFNVLDEDYKLDWPAEHDFADPGSIDRNEFASDANCATCVVAPLCMGECEWERRMFKDNCIALKYTLDRYVLKLRSFFPALEQGEHVLLLLPPRDLNALYEQPFRPWSHGVMGS